MKLFLDHCVSKRTVDHLRKLGHDILTSKDLGKEKAFHPDVLELATNTDRVMITEDRGALTSTYFQLTLPSLTSSGPTTSSS